MAKSASVSIFGLPRAIVKFFIEARDELKKVSWPDRQTTINYTVIVIVSSIAIGVITGGVDYLLSLLLKLFI